IQPPVYEGIGYKLEHMDQYAGYEKRLIIRINKVLSNNEPYMRLYEHVQDQLDPIVYEIAPRTKLGTFNGYDHVTLTHGELQDIIKPGIRERFDRLRRMGVKTVMVTGDNPLTAKYIAEKAGVDDFIAEAKPEDKMEYIKREQQSGKLVAMMGDGTNDAPALAQADVGVAMNSGTQAAKEAGNMVDLDNDPTKLIEIVEIGKQLLMTRGTLTTFSIANDVAKYFAIVPALFIAAIPSLEALNLMHLHSPESAILSAVIFNAIIIPLLIPLALRGVKYKPIGASALLRRNLFIYGLGGVIVPFIGIKLIDMFISLFC
ncbi:HAD-IC family P-type ATPase, partial [Alistipes indistinctus]|uniref:HAD-IC family P-type ATPase n=1 Tax=Alistipes indistinctus TaxID=626932 RepID=UPI00241E4DA8